MRWSAKDLSDIKPGFPIITNLRGSSSRQMGIAVKPWAHSGVILFPFLFQLIPMQLVPAGHGKLQIIVTAALIFDQALPDRLEVYASQNFSASS